MENVKFRIASNFGEIEFEGAEAFVEKHTLKLKDYINIISVSDSNDKKIQMEETFPNVELSTKKTNSKIIVPEAFGEWLTMFKDDLLDIDKALLTAYYVQQQSQQNEFKTSDVNAALLEHGIKLSNPSRDLTYLTKKKYMFQTRKDGASSIKRVSASGEEYLKTLFAEE